MIRPRPFPPLPAAGRPPAPPRTSPRRRRSALAALVAAALLAPASSPPPLAAAGVKLFRQQSRASFLPGTLDGIGIDPLGTLQLADRVERLADVEEPFLFAAAPHPDGWVLGTGNGGRVLLLTREGEVSTLHTAEEPEIFAVWTDPDGTVFAGSSPDGKVYRIAGGEAEVLFDPGETYIWSLARSADGDLLVGTGTEGRIYRVGADGEGELHYDSDDLHIRALKPLPGGDVLAGTAGEGQILRVAPDGEARTLFDAAQPEVVAFAAAGDGVCYAAVLASEASRVSLAEEGDDDAEGEEEEEEGDGSEEGSVTVVEGSGAGFLASRPPGFRGPRSEILRIAPSGRVESVWSFEEETVYSLLWHRERLWVGTGLEGKLYSFRDGKMVLEKDVDERQVVALVPDRPGPAFATTNAAALYVISDRTERRGVYTSPTLDAGQIARFGTLMWRGEQPAGSSVAFSVRSGMSSEPDRTWSPWTEPAGGGEVALGGVPAARYVQWRALLEAGRGVSPRITEVALSYRQENLAPRVARLDVLDPGEILVPANFNPSNQVFEPVAPTREGIFTTLEASDARDTQRVKPLWKKGYRTLRWQVEDENDDELRYAIHFRPEGRPVGGDGGWLGLADDLEDDYHSFDASVLPDGVYRFRLSASDAEANPAGEALVAEETSEPVVIDHSPPELVRVARDGGTIVVEVRDALLPLREASLSVDAEGWRPAPTADGLLDSRSERLELEVPADGGLLLLRVMDAAFNARTFDLGGELE